MIDQKENNPPLAPVVVSPDEVLKMPPEKQREVALAAFERVMKTHKQTIDNLAKR